VADGSGHHFTHVTLEFQVENGEIYVKKTQMLPVNFLEPIIPYNKG